jgi:hypothetical protein
MENKCPKCGDGGTADKLCEKCCPYPSVKEIKIPPVIDGPVACCPCCSFSVEEFRELYGRDCGGEGCTHKDKWKPENIK